MSFCVLILLFLAFIFPLTKHETESYIETFFWIWGLPSYSSTSAIILMILFLPISIGIIIEIAFLLKSYFIIFRDKTKAEVVSKDWIKRGREIIVLELIWILWMLFLIYIVYPFGIYRIEVTIFLPILSGTMLIIAGNLSSRLEIDKKIVLYKKPNFKVMYGLYLFVFILYSIFFSLFFTVLIFPDIYFSNVLFFYIFFSCYHINPMLLALLIIVFERLLDKRVLNNPDEQNQLVKLYILTLLIVGILIIIYFLLNWIHPTIRYFFSWFD
ncbi:MAG: hypothetical protein ACXABG_06710 [Promethearchaeota archaeon]